MHLILWLSFLASDVLFLESSSIPVFMMDNFQHFSIQLVSGELSHSEGSNEGWGGRVVGQGPTVLALGAGGGCLDIFTLIYPFSSFSLSLGDGPI